MKKILSLAALATFLLGGSAHAATLILDGDFANANPSFATIFNGSSFGPWNVTSGSIDLIGGYWQSPTVGGGSVDLDGKSPGSISQVFNAPAGNYMLNFSLSGNPDGGIGTKFVQVSVGGTTETFSYNVTAANARPSSMLYAPESVAFSTPGGPIALSFLSLDGAGSFGAVVGGVSVVSSVPLPASLMLFISGLTGLFFFARRRQQNTKI